MVENCDVLETFSTRKLKYFGWSGVCVPAAETLLLEASTTLKALPCTRPWPPARPVVVNVAIPADALKSTDDISTEGPVFI